MRVIATIAILTLLLSGCTPGASSTSGSIRGRVVNETKYRIPGALISINQTAITTTSDANGYFAVDSVPAGNQVLTVASPGSVASSFPITVLGGKEIDVLCPLQFDIPDDTTECTVILYNATTYTIGIRQTVLQPGEHARTTFPLGRHSVWVTIDGFAPTTYRVVVRCNPSHNYFVYNDGKFYFETH